MFLFFQTTRNANTGKPASLYVDRITCFPRVRKIFRRTQCQKQVNVKSCFWLHRDTVFHRPIFQSVSLQALGLQLCSFESNKQKKRQVNKVAMQITTDFSGQQHNNFTWLRRNSPRCRTYSKLFNNLYPMTMRTADTTQIHKSITTKGEKKGCVWSYENLYHTKKDQHSTTCVPCDIYVSTAWFA